MEQPEANQVRLQCVKDGRKLRVRIISQGYNSAANCQFPRDIRAEGRQYLVPAQDVTFTENARMKFFYRIKKTNIKIVEPHDESLKNIKVYGDEDNKECIICMSESENLIVYVPCGHYNTCSDCAKKLQTCPSCRSKIIKTVTRDQLE